MVGMRLTAAVLAGGRSRRMGTDKALIRLDPSGPTLLERVLELVGAVADDRVVIATDRPHYAAFGVPVEPDHYPDAAALGGIATALEVAAGSPCLVVPCDLPFLNVPLLSHLRARAAAADVVVPTARGESRQRGGVIFQTLHAIYGPACLPPVRAQLARGERQIVRFFDDIRVATVDEEVVRRFDPDLWTFFNVNTPEALSLARAHDRDLRTGSGAS
jgi:molybdopterin-guanine dinucleotide biosynthesis protein A